MDDRDFAELISVFLKGNESEETPDSKKKVTRPNSEKDSENQISEAEIRKNIIEALAEKIKGSGGIESAEETLAPKETIVEEVILKQPVEDIKEELVTKEEVEQLLNSDETLDLVNLQQILHQFIDLDGVIAAVLVTRDGFTIDYASDIELEMDMVSAVIATGFGTLDKIGHELNQGNLTTAMLEYEHGPVLISPLIKDAMLIVVASQWTTLGRIRWEMKKKSAEIVAHL